VPTAGVNLNSTATAVKPVVQAPPTTRTPSEMIFSSALTFVSVLGSPEILLGLADRTWAQFLVASSLTIAIRFALNILDAGPSFDHFVSLPLIFFSFYNFAKAHVLYCEHRKVRQVEVYTAAAALEEHRLRMSNMRSGLVCFGRSLDDVLDMSDVILGKEYFKACQRFEETRVHNHFHRAILDGRFPLFSEDDRARLRFDLPLENLYYVRHGVSIGRKARKCLEEPLPAGRLTTVSAQIITFFPPLWVDLPSYVLLLEFSDYYIALLLASRERCPVDFDYQSFDRRSLADLLVEAPAPIERLTQVSGKAPVNLDDVLTPSGDVEEYTLGGEVLGALEDVKSLCIRNPELATLDAALTFLAIVYNSNGSWAATLVAAKTLVKDVALSMPAQQFMRDTIAQASLQGMSPGSSIFEELEQEPEAQVPEMNGEDVRDYVQLMTRWERPESAIRRYYDGNLSAKEFAGVMERMRKLEKQFERVYGFTGNGMRPYDFARKCRAFKELAVHVTIEDTLSQNSAIDVLLGGLSRAKSASHLIIGNTVILALASILGMGFLKTHAVALHEISMNIMGPGKDYAKLLKSLCGVIKDSAIYLAYVLTGDVRILKATEDPLTRSMIAQDRLEADLRDVRGDQYQLITTIQSHTAEVGMRHARARMAQNPGEANPWGALLLRSLQLRDDATRRTYGNNKKKAFVLTLEGAPETGKTSTINEWAERIVSAVRNESAPEDGSFGNVFMQSDPTFYDGIVVGQHVVGADDCWGHIKAAAPGDSSIKTWLQMCSEAVIMAPMSDVKDKGKIPLAPDFVFVAENSLVDAMGRFTPIIAAVLRRSDVHLRFKFKPGMKAGQKVDYDKDVVVERCSYLAPRDNSLAMGEFVVQQTGTIDEIMQSCLTIAEAYGAKSREQLDRRMLHGVCRTCRQKGCELGSGVPRSLHFDQKIQDATRKFDLTEAEVPQQELVVVSAAVVLSVAYALYWGLRSFRMAWWVRNVDEYQHTDVGTSLAFWVATPLAWLSGWLALTALLPIHLLACFAIQGDWPGWASWQDFRDKVVKHVMFGDLIAAKFTPWIKTRYIMARMALGYSVRVEEAVAAFKASSKYRVLMRLVAAIGLFAGLYATHHVSGAIRDSRTLAKANQAHYKKQLDENPERTHFQVLTMNDLKGLSLNAGPDWTSDGVRRVLMRYTIHRYPISESAVVIPVGSGLGLTVTHLFPTKGDFKVSQSGTFNKSVFQPTPYNLPKRFVEALTSDFSIVRDAHVGLYDKRLVLKALPPETRLAYSATLGMDNEFRVEDVLAVRISGFDLEIPGVERKLGFAYKVDKVTFKGECGSPLIALDRLTGELQIFATLVATDNKTFSVYQAITPDVVKRVSDIRATMPDGPSLQSLELVSARLPVEVVESTLHPKSALLYSNSSSIRFLGRTKPEISSVPKCEMVHTSFHDVVESEFSKPDTFRKPEWRPRLYPERDFPYGMMTQHIDELNNAFDGLIDQQEPIKHVEAKFQSIFTDTPKGRVLTVREALNGVPGRIKGINRSTSVGGWGRFGPKTQAFEDSACPHYPNGVELAPGFDGRVEDILRKWRFGVSVPPTCRIIPKMNEVREKPIARQINVVEMEWIVASRTLLEPIHEVMRNTRAYASMIGRSPIGPEWAWVHNSLRKVNPKKGTDVDGSKFDKKHGATIRKITEDAYDYIATKLGYSEEDRRATRQCVHDTFLALQCFMGEVFISFYGIISGVPGTGDIQTFIGWFVTRLILVILYTSVVLDDENLFSAHGGDDIVKAVAEWIGYSGADFARVGRSLGYDFTSDTDKSKPPEAVPIEQLSFYKRTFLVDGERVLAPLAEKSVRKSLMWRDASAKVQPRIQELAILETAVSESFLLGAAKYPAAAERIRRIGKSAGYEVPVPTWAQLAARFDKGELRTWNYEPEVSLGSLCDCRSPLSMISGTIDLSAQERPMAPQELDSIDAGSEQIVQAEGRKLALPFLKEVTAALMRPVLIGETTWTGGLTTTVFPISGLIADAIYGRNMNNFYGHRAVLCVKLSIVLPPMSSGVLVASLYANNNIDAFSSKNCHSPAQIITHDASVLIDVAVGNSAVLRKQIPRWADSMVTGSSDAFIGPHCLRLALAELVPVASSLATSTPNPVIFTWAWLEDSEQLGPTPLTQVSGQVLGEFAAKFAKPVVSFAMSAMPVVGGVLRAGRAFADSMIELGFSMPAQLPQLSYIFTRFSPFLSTTQGVDATVRLSLEPMSMVQHNQEVFRGVSEDLLSIKSILSRPSLAGTFAWNMAQTAHTRIAVIPVHPCLGGGAGTPLAWLSTFFQMWTGSLKFTFYFSVPSTARGSVIIIYTPNLGSPLPTYSQLTQCQPIIVDVAGSTSVTIDVGWHQLNTASQLTTAAWPTIATYATAVNPNGYFSVFVQQPFVASGASAFSTSVVVTMEPGEDFAYLDPNLDYPNNLILVSAQLRTPLFQSATRHFDHRIEGARRTPEQLLSMSGGEIIKSLRTLIKRKTPHYVKRFDGSTGDTTGVAVDLPWFTAGFPTQPETGGSPTDPEFQVLPCNLSNAAVPFAAFAGSVRHTIYPVSNDGTTGIGSQGLMQCFAVRRPAGNNGGILYWGYGSNIVSSEGLAFMQMANGGDLWTSNIGQGSPVSVELPFIAQRFALPVPTANANGDSALRVGFVFGGLTAITKLALIDYVSAGDDFDLFEWVGVPSMTYSLADSSYWQITS